MSHQEKSVILINITQKRLPLGGRAEEAGKECASKVYGERLIINLVGLLKGEPFSLLLLPPLLCWSLLHELRRKLNDSRGIISCLIILFAQLTVLYIFSSLTATLPEVVAAAAAVARRGRPLGCKAADVKMLGQPQHSITIHYNSQKTESP